MDKRRNGVYLARYSGLAWLIEKCYKIRTMGTTAFLCDPERYPQNAGTALLYSKTKSRSAWPRGFLGKGTNASAYAQAKQSHCMRQSSVPVEYKRHHRHDATRPRKPAANPVLNVS